MEGQAGNLPSHGEGSDWVDVVTKSCLDIPWGDAGGVGSIVSSIALSQERCQEAM